MARPRTITDGEILAGARACFLEHGPGVSTTAIAEGLGLSQAALFKRFGSKKELMLQALLPPAEPPWLDLLRRGPDPRPVAEQLVEIGVAAGHFFEEVTPALMMLEASGIDRREVMSRFEVPPPARALQELSAFFQRAIDQGRIRPVNTLDLAMTFLGLLHGRSFLRRIAGTTIPFTSLEEAVAQHVDVLWRGLVPAERPR